MKQTITKCTLNGELVHPCQTLINASEVGNPRGKAKGIFGWVFHNTTTLKISRTFFGAKSGEFISGIRFNFCPFCGEQINTEERTKTVNEKHQGNRLLRRRNVEAKTGLSRATIYAFMKAGCFPKPIPLSANRVAWIEAEIDEWINQRIEERKK